MAEQELEKAKEKVKKKRGLKFFLTCAILALLCLLITGLVVAILWFTGFVSRTACPSFTSGSRLYSTFNCSSVETQGEVVNEDDKFPTKEGGNDTQVSQEEIVVTRVVEEAEDSIVAIGIKTESGENEVIGSGFLVSPNGLIVTNQHVVSELGVTYYVTIKGEADSLEVKKIHRDVLNDIALLEVDGENYPYLTLGDSDKLKLGQTVVAIGNPLGSLAGTVTSGIISGLHREVQLGVGFGGLSKYDDVIQTDAAINPGNSGGPLLNSSAKVIGVNFATVSGADNLSFALPINRVKNKIDELNKYGELRVPFIGVEYRSKLVFVDGNSVIGAQIVKIDQDGPAKTSGLKVDDIVIAFNSDTLDEKSLTVYVQESEIGEKVTLTVLRDGETQEIEVTIGER